jgi:ribosomal protein S18 acetylase RimI-like enzyme
VISFEAVVSSDQAEELRLLRNECREYMTGDTAEIAPRQQKQFLDQQIRPGRVHAWLLRVEGDAAGYALLRPGNRGELWMSCGVAAAQRGRGLGVLTVDLVTAMARHINPRRPVRLQVWQDNEPAVRAYRRAGYLTEETAERDGRVIETMACQ